MPLLLVTPMPLAPLLVLVLVVLTPWLELDQRLYMLLCIRAAATSATDASPLDRWLFDSIHWCCYRNRANCLALASSAAGGYGYRSGSATALTKTPALAFDLAPGSAYLGAACWTGELFVQLQLLLGPLMLDPDLLNHLLHPLLNEFTRSFTR